VLLTDDLTNQFSVAYEELLPYLNVADAMRWDNPDDVYARPPYTYGSKASPLMQMLAGGHHGVMLSEEERLRICRGHDCTEFEPDHNSVWLVLRDGDAVEYSFTLRDEDTAVDDTWCGTEEDYSFDPGGNVEVPIYIGPYTVDEWTTIDRDFSWENDDYEVLSDQDARCALVIHMRGEVPEDVEVPPEEGP